MLAWTKQNTMQRAMRTVLEWPQSHATSKHYKYNKKKILLQIAVRMSIMASPPAWTNCAGMFSMPVDFPIFSALTIASTSSRRIG